MMEKYLIEGCKKRERKAQKELYEMYSRKMMGVCLRYVGDRETARDLLQEGFVRVFTSIDSYSEKVRLRGGYIRFLLIVH